MKRIFALLALALLLVSCGPDGSSSDPVAASYSSKIADWQQREAAAPAIQTQCVDIKTPITRDIVYILRQVPVPEWMKENSDYWKTSAETIQDGGGDCEDISALTLRTLSDSCLKENYKGIEFRMRILKKPSDTVHVVTTVYYGDETYDIDNWKFITSASNLPVLAEFDLEQIYF